MTKIREANANEDHNKTGPYLLIKRLTGARLETRTFVNKMTTTFHMQNRRKDCSARMI